MKAIIKNTSLNYDYYNTYNICIDDTTSVDVKISANVYKVANNLDCYDIEINDTEIDYYVNNIKTLWQGYKKLYIELYGETAFTKQVELITKTAEDEFISGLKDRKLLMNLTPAAATKYIKKLLKKEKKYKTLKTIIKVDDVDKEITYSSNYIIAKLAKVVNENLVFKKECQCTYGTSTVNHLITDISSFL